MSAQHRRWLTLREMLSLQGFPTDCEFTYGKPCSSFALRTHRASLGLESEPWPTRRSVCHQSGNSMHVAVSGVVLLFCLSQVVLWSRTVESSDFSAEATMSPSWLVWFISFKQESEALVFSLRQSFNTSGWSYHMAPWPFRMDMILLLKTLLITIVIVSTNSQKYCSRGCGCDAVLVSIYWPASLASHGAETSDIQWPAAPCRHT